MRVNEDRRRQRQHRHQRDQLNDALVQPTAIRGVLTEIDADILRGERRCRYYKCRY
jgi:hypothetical protein